jgi:hypothetical protein
MKTSTRIEKIKGAQSYLQDAIKLIEKATKDSACTTSGLVDQLRIIVSSDHGLLSNDLNLDDIIQKLLEEAKADTLKRLNTVYPYDKRAVKLGKLIRIVGRLFNSESVQIFTNNGKTQYNVKICANTKRLYAALRLAFPTAIITRHSRRQESHPHAFITYPKFIRVRFNYLDTYSEAEFIKLIKTAQSVL